MNINLIKGKEKISIRINGDKGEMRKMIGGNSDTSVLEMTALEANRKINQLLRQGYTTKK